MKKFLVILILFLLPLLVAGKSYNQKVYQKDNFDYTCIYPETYEDFITRVLCNMKLFSPIYKDIFYISVKEQVDFLEILPLLMVENTTVNPFAVGINYKKEYSKSKREMIQKVVSKDKGLFQLNSMYESYFEEKYWKGYSEKEEFNIFNYIHNSTVAMRLYKDLKSSLENQTFYAVIAYNAGIGSVLNKQVPEKTYKEYIQNYYKNKNKINRSK